MKQSIHISLRSPQPLSTTPTVAIAQSQTRVSSLRFLSVSTSCLVVAAALLLAGCGDNKSAVTMKPEDVTTINPDATAVEQQNQRIKVAVGIRDGIMPPEPALKLKGGEPATPEVLEAYNQLLLRAMVQRKEPAETLEELRKWPLPKLPTPPAGKQIVYDAAICGIRLDPP